MRKILMLMMFALVLSACGSETSSEQEPAVIEDQNTEFEVEDDRAWDEVKDMDKIVGKSDKDFADLTNNKPSKVRNDNTGNWRVTTISESVDIEEYILSYHDLHMNEGEVHFIVNFNRNTTTWINKMGGLLYVEIRERVEREEHDAKALGSGMTLKSYTIYPDGDIQEL